MTSEAVNFPRASSAARLSHGHMLPVLIIVAAILVIWYIASVWLNAPFIADADTLGFLDLVRAAWSAERPVLPAPPRGTFQNGNC